MEVFYLTTKKYPSTTADNIYVYELSRALTKLLREDFSLVVRQSKLSSKDVNIIETKQSLHSRLLNFTIFFINKYFFKKTDKNLIFISNDQNILLVVIFVKIILFKNYKVVFDAHMLSETWKDNIIIKLSDKIITTSDVLNSNISGYLKHASKVKTIYGGVNIEKFANISKQEGAGLCKIQDVQNKIVIGYIGGFKSLGQDKGLKTVIKALSFLDEKFIFIGVGGTDEEIEELFGYAKEAGVQDRCILHKKVNNEDVPLYLLICDVLVIPYPAKKHFTDYGFPMKVFEYMAADKKILYSDLKITNDFLSQFDKSLCRSFEPENPESFAKEVVLITSENNSNQKSFKEHIKSYTWKKKAESIIEFINNSL